MAFADAFGGNAWRQTVRAVFETEAAKCPNITETLYTDANGNPEQYASDVRGLIAQDVDAIITFNDFGEATLPAIRAAMEAGVTIVPFNVDPGGEAGVDYTEVIVQDFAATGAGWADWFGDLLGEGDLVMLGGTAGNPQSIAFLEGFRARAQEAHQGLNLLEDEPITTSWTPEGTQEAVAGMISRHGDDIDGYISDYTATLPALIRAYEAAGEEPPPFAGLAYSNEVGCEWPRYRERFPAFELKSFDGTPRMSAVALRKALADVQGISNEESPVVALEPFIDTPAGDEPPCDPDLPPDADLSAGLPVDRLTEVLGG